MIEGMKLAIVALLVGACTPELPSAPAVHVVGDASPAVLDGIRGWAPLGFEVSADDSGLDECGLHWYREGTTDCQITIGVVRSGIGAHSFRDQRAVYIDATYEGVQLMTAAAHEAGHILLDTSTHTPTGIMSGRWPRMSADDRALACSSISICIE